MMAPRGILHAFVKRCLWVIRATGLANNSVLVAELAFSHLDKVTQLTISLQGGRVMLGCTDPSHAQGIPGFPEQRRWLLGTRNYAKPALVNYNPANTCILPSWDRVHSF